MNALAVYSRAYDLQLLKDFYYQDDQRGAGANLIVEEICKAPNVCCQRLFLMYSQTPSTEQIGKLKMALKMYTDAGKGFTFEAKATDEQIRLLSLQTVLERDTGQSFQGCSIGESIVKCLSLGHSNRAAKIAKDFKVPDKRQAHPLMRE